MKQIVEFRTLDGNAEMVYSGRAVLEGGIVSFVDCPAKFIRSLNEDGIIGRAADGFLYPADGMKFMEALQIEFSGSYFRASAPVEVK